MLLICNGTPEPSEGRDLIPLADVLIVNEQEAIELAGDDGSWVEIAERLAGLGPRTVILTLGAEGAVVWHEGDTRPVATIPVEVVDTTGAGDAFCGAYAAFVAAGADPFEAAAKAVVAGSLAVTRAGAQPSIATLAEIERATPPGN